MNIAKLIYDNYPESDLLNIDPEKHLKDLDTLYEYVTNGDCGDSLFKFIVVEAKDGAGGEINQTIQQLYRAVNDCYNVINALEAESSKQNG